MWNSWNKKECDIIFGEISDHIWHKWEAIYFKDFSDFYSYLDENCQNKLVERATSLYDGYKYKGK